MGGINSTSAPSSQRRALAGSRAFQEAALRSEVRRAYAVMGVVLLIVGLVLIGRSREELDKQIRIIAGVGVCILFAMQIGVLLIAHWAKWSGRTIPIWVVILSVLAESLIPTGIILYVIVHRVLPP